MRYRFGNARVSGHQRRLIEKAKNALGPQWKTKVLLQLLRSPDVETGTETIASEWLGICAHLQDSAERRPRSRRLDQFVNAARELIHHSPQIGRIDIHQRQVAFLLGAGMSRPAPTNIPTVNELLPDLLARARRQDRDDLTALADFCEARGIRHIEDLLTAAQLSQYCSRHPEVLRLVNFLLYGQRLNGDTSGSPSRRRESSGTLRPTRGPSDKEGSVSLLADTLQVLFGLISGWMLPAQPNDAHHALATYCVSHPEAHLVTTNYDCCVDRALDQAGVESNYGIEFGNQVELGDVDRPQTALLKLHGSLNWFYCDNCQDVHLVPIASAVRSFLAPPSVRIPYPVIGHCDGCNGLRRPLLVPPQALKFDVGPPLTPLIEQATEVFSRADLIVAVGFSFADSDLHITRSLTRAMKANRHSSLVVIDPDFEVSERIARKLAIRIAEFDRSRVLKIVSGCTESLPAFLAGDYFKVGESRTEPTRHHVARPGLPVIG